MAGADMKQEQQTGKRIVSKGTYVANIVDKFCVYAGGALGILLCLLCLGCVGLLFYELREISTSELPLFVILVLLMSGGTWFVFPRAKKIIQAANEMDVGVPLTCANTADLPALDSLVRASSEPLQAQEAVLLRAAEQEQETPPEQLVRASMGRE